MTFSPGVALSNLAIRGYQRYISPYKGFCCAHRALHGGPGCSEAIRRIIEVNGVWNCWPRVRERFAQCREAALTLRAGPLAAGLFGAQSEADQRDRKKKRGDTCDGVDCGGDCIGDSLSGCDLPCDCSW
jgi:putative component of membrane protein insertase Oxa1/YidC/SpoIIIJ protein YidD